MSALPDRSQTSVDSAAARKRRSEPCPHPVAHVELARMLATLFVVVGAGLLRHAASPDSVSALAFAFVGFAGVLLCVPPRALRRILAPRSSRLVQTAPEASLPDGTRETVQALPRVRSGSLPQSPRQAARLTQSGGRREVGGALR